MNNLKITKDFWEVWNTEIKASKPVCSSCGKELKTGDYIDHYYPAFQTENACNECKIMNETTQLPKNDLLSKLHQTMSEEADKALIKGLKEENEALKEQNKQLEKGFQEALKVVDHWKEEYKKAVPELGYKITIDDMKLIIKALGCLAGVEIYNGESERYIERIDNLNENLKKAVEGR